jgi:hypothetical protein
MIVEGSSLQSDFRGNVAHGDGRISMASKQANGGVADTPRSFLAVRSSFPRHACARN